MSCCYTYYRSDRHYLKSPVGVLKCLNIILGIISLILLCASFTPIFEDEFSITTVIISLIFSTIYFILYMMFPELRYFKKNRQFDNGYHLFVGLLLILAGLDITSLTNSTNGLNFNQTHKFSNNILEEQYFEPGYVKGCAKIFIFINGVIYEIIGFIRVKGEEESFDFADIELDDEDDERQELLCDV